MSYATNRGLPPALTAKIQAFAGSLAPEEAAQMRQMAQERASAASAPAALAEKLSAFTDGLSADEVALAQAVERTQETEVESYLGTIIPSTYHKGTSDKNALLAVGRALWEAVIDVNNIL